jgi:hypothetical protein
MALLIQLACAIAVVLLTKDAGLAGLTLVYAEHMTSTHSSSHSFYWSASTAKPLYSLNRIFHR